MYNIRSDLALEAREMYRQSISEKQEVPGVSVEEENIGVARVTRVKIETRDGELALNKPMGNYITIEMPELHNGELDHYDTAENVLAAELKRILHLDKKTVALVVGLGNRNITADALGPKTIEKLMITRHMFDYIPDQIDEGVRSVCALAPGVLGITGIETGEIVLGVKNRVEPDLIIAIDALAARRVDRINTTIQIADTGICPGSGVGNARKALSRSTIGVPVIAIGVPTVVDAVTMASDTVDLLLAELSGKEESELAKNLGAMTMERKSELLDKTLSPYLGNMTVTTKEVDQIADKMSKVIANGINLALHDGISKEDILLYL